MAIVTAPSPRSLQAQMTTNGIAVPLADHGSGLISATGRDWGATLFTSPRSLNKAAVARMSPWSPHNAGFLRSGDYSKTRATSKPASSLHPPSGARRPRVAPPPPVDVPAYASRLANVHCVASANMQLRRAHEARAEAWSAYTTSLAPAPPPPASVEASPRARPRTAGASTARSSKLRGGGRDVDDARSEVETIRTLQQQVEAARDRLAHTMERLAVAETRVADGRTSRRKAAMVPGA